MATAKTFTSKEVALQLGIAPITLRSILAEHGDEIPSTGTAPRLRFDQAGVEKIRELRSVRKKPRGRAAQAAKRAAAAAAAKPGRKRNQSPAAPVGPTTGGGEGEAPEGYLSLKDIERATQISYPTLMRYVKHDLDLIPSLVVGSRRHFAPEAVEVFLQLRSRSRAGRKPKGFVAVAASSTAVRPATVAAAPAVAGVDLASALAAIEARLAAIEAELRRPLSLAVVRS